ncbi:alpha/beta hydrolase [Chitiniphilus eburneus]|uniref:Alpha/beta hydrolase n=1 Tax=Chitiniphilus eburneus TaxID=2571148 RepID=A0A4U0Q7Y1_9NEIS|nr:alpha/beta hydrolase-fold protein [Chitiniphilus eburneus]TJZ77357.1 alpha/beta hydrolase [Chitiniphilus eburneus]
MTRLYRALAACMLLILAGCAAPQRDGWQPVTLPGAVQRTLHSNQTGRDYRLFVAVPDAPPPPGGYPVLYLLDGNATFALAAQVARTQRGLDPAVVVGIGYPIDGAFDVVARAEDYTPPLPDALPADAPRTKYREGGAARFLDFIEHTLKPDLAARWPLNPSRQALYGHSYGGLFTLYVLFSRPDAFQSYIAVSPSVWWGERWLLRDHPLPAVDHVPQVWIGVGGLEQGGADTPAMDRAKLAERAMIDGARTLAGTLRAQGIDARFTVLEGQNHLGALYASVPRAVLRVLGGPAATDGPPKRTP